MPIAAIGRPDAASSKTSRTTACSTLARLHIAREGRKNPLGMSGGASEQAFGAIGVAVVDHQHDDDGIVAGIVRLGAVGIDAGPLEPHAARFGWRAASGTETVPPMPMTQAPGERHQIRLVGRKKSAHGPQVLHGRSGDRGGWIAFG